MERLELLGDSVLKYVVSCHLFLKYPTKHEGELSELRKGAICNSNLHKLGTARKLQVFELVSAIHGLESVSVFCCLRIFLMCQPVSLIIVVPYKLLDSL